MYWTSFKCYKIECTVDYFYPSLREVVDRYVVPSSTHSQLTHWVLIQDIAGYCWSQRYTRISSYQGRSSNTCDQIKNERSRGNLRKHEQGCDLCASLHCNNFTKTNNAKAQGIPILANVNILSPYHHLTCIPFPSTSHKPANSPSPSSPSSSPSSPTPSPPPSPTSSSPPSPSPSVSAPRPSPSSTAQTPSSTSDQTSTDCREPLPPCAHSPRSRHPCRRTPSRRHHRCCLWKGAKMRLRAS